MDFGLDFSSPPSIPLLVERVIGLFLLLFGTSILIQSKFWLAYIDDLMKKPRDVIPVGLVGFLLSLVLLVTHNIWVATPQVIVTLLGWFLLAKYLLFFLSPETLVHLGKNMATQKLFGFAGAIYAFLGAILSYYVFFEV